MTTRRRTTCARIEQRCSECGRAWPHPLLYRTLQDIEAHERGRCPWCAFGLTERPQDVDAQQQQLALTFED